MDTVGRSGTLAATTREAPRETASADISRILRRAAESGFITVAWLSRAGKLRGNARLGRARLQVMLGLLVFTTTLTERY
jgi:hypothetical protein